MPGIGRPMKYRPFLEALEEEKIYTPATIVHHGESRGLFDPTLSGQDLKQAKLRVRHALARRSAMYKFPQFGDGWIVMSGQPPLRGWTGVRWKATLPSKKADATHV